MKGSVVLWLVEVANRPGTEHVGAAVEDVRFALPAAAPITCMVASPVS